MAIGSQFSVTHKGPLPTPWTHVHANALSCQHCAACGQRPPHEKARAIRFACVYHAPDLVDAHKEWPFFALFLVSPRRVYVCASILLPIIYDPSARHIGYRRQPYGNGGLMRGRRRVSRRRHMLPLPMRRRSSHRARARRPRHLWARSWEAMMSRCREAQQHDTDDTPTMSSNPAFEQQGTANPVPPSPEELNEEFDEATFTSSLGLTSSWGAKIWAEIEGCCAAALNNRIISPFDDKRQDDDGDFTRPHQSPLPHLSDVTLPFREDRETSTSSYGASVFLQRQQPWRSLRHVRPERHGSPSSSNV